MIVSLAYPLDLIDPCAGSFWLTLARVLATPVHRPTLLFYPKTPQRSFREFPKTHYFDHIHQRCHLIHELLGTLASRHSITVLMVLPKTPLTEILGILAVSADALISDQEACWHWQEPFTTWADALGATTPQTASCWPLATLKDLTAQKPPKRPWLFKTQKTRFDFSSFAYAWLSPQKKQTLPEPTAPKQETPVGALQEITLWAEDANLPPWFFLRCLQASTTLTLVGPSPRRLYQRLEKLYHDLKREKAPFLGELWPRIRQASSPSPGCRQLRWNTHDVLLEDDNSKISAWQYLPSNTAQPSQLFEPLLPTDTSTLTQLGCCTSLVFEHPLSSWLRQRILQEMVPFRQDPNSTPWHHTRPWWVEPPGWLKSSQKNSYFNSTLLQACLATAQQVWKQRLATEFSPTSFPKRPWPSLAMADHLGLFIKLLILRLAYLETQDPLAVEETLATFLGLSPPYPWKDVLSWFGLRRAYCYAYTVWGAHWAEPLWALKTPLRPWPTQQSFERTRI